MEKIVTETEIKEVKTRYHEFYCDKCKKLIGNIREYDDGYVPSPPKLTQVKFTISVGNDTIKSYARKHHLCEECREKFIKEVDNYTAETGFAVI